MKTLFLFFLSFFCLISGAGERLLNNAQPMFLNGKTLLTGKQAQNVTLRKAPDAPGSWIVTIPNDAPHYRGIAFLPEDNRDFLDFTGYTAFSIDIENLDLQRQADCWIIIFSQPEKGDVPSRSRGCIALNPGEKRTLRFPLWAFDSECRIRLPIFLRSGRPQGISGGEVGINPRKVTSVLLFSRAPDYCRSGGSSTRLRVSRPRLTNEAPQSRAPLHDPARFFPLIDRYGQYKHDEWPEKVHCDRDLADAGKREKAELDRLGRPKEWNRFGGWKNGPAFKATGFFRTEKVNGRWALIDPEGKLFFSLGVGGVHYRGGAVDTSGERAAWYEVDLKGAKTWDPLWSNLQKKYGAGSLTEELKQLTHRRLAAWGFNTIGPWSEARIYLQKRTPYTIILADWGERDAGMGSFYDPFNPLFPQSLEKRFALKENSPSVNDPYCIGYFIHNELALGNETNAACMALRSTPETPAKKEFLRRLLLKYGTPEKLGKAWGIPFDSQKAFLESVRIPGTKEGNADLAKFTDTLVNEYFRICRDTVRKCAPNQLYLGSRPCYFPAWLNRIMARYCDVVSINLYAPSPEPVRFDMPDKPVMITEFHLCVLQRGMFQAGILNSPVGLTEKERLTALERYFEGAIRHPQIVGLHWFCYRDQPVLGRSNGENAASGLVDITDTPYSELLKVFRHYGENFPRLKWGNK